MDDRDFIFSLYPNDLFKATSRKTLTLKLSQPDSTLPPEYCVKSELLYFKGADINTASFAAINHDNSYKARGIGIKTLENLEKYTVDVLGTYHAVGKETRQPFYKKRG